ncbi:MAG: hypothetical protein WD080_11660 [Egibacteraceae bacterium]
MGDVEFTAGITLRSGAVLTADVTTLDAAGIAYRTEHGSGFASWGEITAVMLATTDHMLQTAGQMLSAAEVLRQQEERGPYDAEALRQRALGLLREVAPRLCPQGQTCPLGAPR